jgi:integrase
LDWSPADPPSFHEIRSLAKRLYDAEGVNTKDLLGHKTERMAATYADGRGYDWVTVG